MVRAGFESRFRLTCWSFQNGFWMKILQHIVSRIRTHNLGTCQNPGHLGSIDVRRCTRTSMSIQHHPLTCSSTTLKPTLSPHGSKTGCNHYSSIDALAGMGRGCKRGGWCCVSRRRICGTWKSLEDRYEQL